MAWALNESITFEDNKQALLQTAMPDTEICALTRQLREEHHWEQQQLACLRDQLTPEPEGELEGESESEYILQTCM